MEFYIFVYKACAVSLYTILVREVDGRFVTLFFNMSQNDLKRPNRILLIFSAIHIKSLAFRFATPSNRGTISPYSNDAIRGCIRNKLNYLFIISVEKDSRNEF